VAGFLMEKELEYLGGILEKPEKPFGGLFGGAKVSDKVALLDNIMGKVDYLFIGGGMAAIFLKVRSFETGISMIEEDRLETAAGLMKKASEKGVKLLLPEDVVVASEISDKAQSETVDVENMPRDKMILDIGPKTVEKYSAGLKKCKTVFWNGTMGVSEMPQFAAGTLAMAETLAGLDAVTVIGGGSTAAAADKMGVAEKMTFISTGGGLRSASSAARNCPEWKHCWTRSNKFV
jgi:phosphoglycerate kinase